jgi:hypothetical protein
MRIGSGGVGEKIEQGRRAIRLHVAVSDCVAAHYANPNNTQLANLYPGCVLTNITHPDNIGASIGQCWGPRRGKLTSKVCWRVFE